MTAPQIDTTAIRTPGLDDEVRLYRRPGLFYALAVGIPWALWLAAGRLSHLGSQTTGLRFATMTLALVGLVAPVAVAWFLVRREPALRRDTVRRLGSFRDVPAPFALAAVALLPASLMVATGISLLLGYPLHQFSVKTSTTVLGGWAVLALAPVVEELAWHSYGTDALASRWSVLRSTLVFSVLWAAWHLPLAGIKGSYQADAVETSALVGANFFVSVLPLMILMNWLYYRCGRNIWVPVVFHLSANLGNELWFTAPDTKVIQTAILLPLCAWVLWHDRALFLTRPEKR